MRLRRDVWTAFAIVSSIAGVVAFAFVLALSPPSVKIAALPQIAAGTVVLATTFCLLVWRCNAGLRDEQRHQELVQAIQSLRPREASAIKPLKERGE